MKLIEALRLINELKVSAFRTNDIAAYLKIEIAHAFVYQKQII